MGAAAVAAAVSVAFLSVAFAAGEPPSWVGSYWGRIQSGGDTVPATIWVEAVDATTAKVSVQVPGLPVLESRGTVYSGSGGSVKIPLEFSGAGVGVASQITLTPQNGVWDITGTGSGAAFGNTGNGQVVAQQYYKWIAMPSLADQFAGTVDALLGKPSPPAGFPETGATQPPPDSPIAPYENRPPLSLADMLATEWVLSLLSLLMFAI
jgi:hypothetical protein